jgi:hypothetical protein
MPELSDLKLIYSEDLKASTRRIVSIRGKTELSEISRAAAGSHHTG